MACRALKRVQPTAGSLRQEIEWLERHPQQRPAEEYAKLIKRCGDQRLLTLGKRLHAHIAARGALAGAAEHLVHMYGCCSDLVAARAVFDAADRSRPQAWSLLISACLAAADKAAAMSVFRQLLCEGSPPLDLQSLCLVLCGGGGAAANLAEARRLQAALAGSNLAHSAAVASAFMTMYRKMGGSLDDIEGVFFNSPRRDAAAWATMAAAYADARRPRSTLALLPYMDLEGERPSVAAYAAMVDACSQLAALEAGRHIEARIVAGASVGYPVQATPCREMQPMGKDDRINAANGQAKDGGLNAAYGQGPSFLRRGSGAAADVILQSALVSMYAKCGAAAEAKTVFERIDSSRRNVVVWTSLISAYARSGRNADALRVFWTMEQDGSSRPDAITFTHVLYACAHEGLVEEAWAYLGTMRLDLGISPRVEHLGCMVDLLSRAGRLAEAEALLRRATASSSAAQAAPKPDAAAWMCLLNACRIHGDLARGARASTAVNALEPSRLGPYSVLSSMYFAAGDKEAALEVLTRMQATGMKKLGGRSWIEIGGKLHEFMVGDAWHPRMVEIVTELRRLGSIMRAAGIAVDMQHCIHQATKESTEVQDLLVYHSEKLALALGVISTPAQTTLRIVKNLRVCPDCHSFAKFVSKHLMRTIVIRDLKLFHHLQDGKCSCGDYW